MLQSFKTDHEVTLTQSLIGVTNRWATLIMPYKRGEITAEELIEEFDGYLHPIGYLLYILLQVPEARQDLIDAGLDVDALGV